MRQALTVIRKTLGSAGALLEVEHGYIGLDPTQFDVAEDDPEADIVEGLEIREPAFEEWLHEFRTSRMIKSACGDGRASCPTPGTRIEAPRLFLCKSDAPNVLPVLTEVLVEHVGQGISEYGGIDVIRREIKGDLRFSRADFIIGAAARSEGTQYTMRLRLEAGFDGRMIWSGVRAADTARQDSIRNPELHKVVNQAVDTALAEYLKLERQSDLGGFPAVRALQAVRAMFRLGDENIDKAGQYLEDAFAADPQGIYLAWQAYRNIVVFGERKVTDRAAVQEEAADLIRQALEISPSSSMIHAIASYVQSMLFRNYLGGFALAQEAIAISAHNPLAWAFQGVARMHLDQRADAFSDVRYAKDISGAGPHRYQLDMLACQAALVAGEYDAALNYGQLARAAAPQYAPPLRYLSALFLQAGRPNEARQALDDLKKLEPGFSIDQMLDQSYPVAALRQTPLLNKVARLV